jgi:outer membrane lipoprotein-sorting protein
LRHNPLVSPFLLIPAILLTGCAALKEVPTGLPRVLTVAEVRAELGENSQKISTLKAKANIIFMSNDLKDPLACSGYIRLESPKKLRIICSKLFNTIFDVVSDGHRFQLYVPKENKLYTGLSNQDVRYLGLRFSPDDVAGILENGEVFKNTVVQSFDVRPEHWYIELFNPADATRYVLLVDRRTLNLIRYDTYTPGGTLRMHAQFDDFEYIDGCRIPRKIDIFWPRGNTKLNLQLKKVRLNEKLNPKIFRLTMPENADVIRLSRREGPSYP